MSFSSFVTRTDVTAVKLFSNYVLAGIGSTINVFSRETATYLYKIQGLHGQKIYGFVPICCGRRILVYGGKQFTVISTDVPRRRDRNEEQFKRCFDPVICNDWIHSALWIDDVTIAILTAHNVVQKWNVTSQTIFVSQDVSRENSILYSGHLLQFDDGVLVLAGTVFSEVIIQKSGDIKPMQRLSGHKGVIFSISCDPKQLLIVTTSDDRSVRVWSPDVLFANSYNTIEYWRSLKFVTKYELYGHSARVMKNCITTNSIVSVGEDSAVCFWDFRGNLVKKIDTHQNGCIWSVDADNQNLVTGGGDCGLILHPLTLNSNVTDILSLDFGHPKKVLFTARRNLIVLYEGNKLIYYSIVNKTSSLLKLKHTSTYKLVSISVCKQLVAVADMDGKLDIFVENCKGESSLVNIINTTLNLGKVLSMHWAGNRLLVLCCDNGRITVLASSKSNVEVSSDFILPPCKERWLTSCDVNTTSNIFILGDRCGNIHIYVKGKYDPVTTFGKVHGRYGPTSINFKNNEFSTTGQDGTIKYFQCDMNSQNYKYMGSKDLEFKWVEKFLDKNENFVCGFQERLFVVYSIKEICKVLEVPCGGGHRSWDAVRFTSKINDNYREVIQFVYLKDSVINLKTFQLSDTLSTSFIKGSHAKEINCLKSYKCELDNAVTIYFSGGEDTTLRISCIDKNVTFEDKLSFKHLSSVKALKLHDIDKNNVIVLSAGGRAQINLRKITFFKSDDEVKIESQELVNYLIKGTDKERKGNRTWRNTSVDFETETRIMDIDAFDANHQLTVICGCSDASVRIFEYKDGATFRPIKELKYHKTCVLKTYCFQYGNSNLLLTSTTRGDLAFWNIDDVLNNQIVNPFFVTKTNLTGINSVDVTLTSVKGFLLATGGEDNTIHLVWLEIPVQDNLSSITIKHQVNFNRHHSSQITGLRFVDNLMISASIDQRITLFKWKVDEFVTCDFLAQFYTDVADIRGLDIVENLSDSLIVCVFGKGMEVMKIIKPK